MFHVSSFKFQEVAIVFISPKQRQKMFFLGITILFLLILVVISLSVFFARPKVVPVEQVFKKPKIDINFKVLDSEQIKSIELMGEIETQFSYQAKTDKGKTVSGKISAISKEKAQKALEEINLTQITLQESQIGRENPFVPYYQIVSSKGKTKTK
jgi:hypothetical protein